MRRTLGPRLLPALLTALLASGLVACGQEAGPPVADDPAPSAAPTNTPLDKPTVIALLSETAAGGRTMTTLVPLGGDGLEGFLEPITSDSLAQEVRSAVADHPASDQHELMGAVVAVGCDVPPEVFVTQGEGGYDVRAGKVASPLPNCLVPVTTIAVVEVPSV